MGESVNIPNAGTEIKTCTGFIGFFDILGYQSFLQTENIPPEIINDVMTVINTLKHKVPKMTLSFIDDTEYDVKGVIEAFNWLVFSDTILITAPIPDAPSDLEIHVIFKILTLLVAFLQRYMLNVGLPIRGAVTHGQVTLSESCFIGTPIVNAYQLSKELDLAATVVEPLTIKYLMEKPIDGTPAQDNSLVTQYLIPLKDGKEKLLSVILPSPWILEDKISWLDKDVKQLVIESFWKYKKQIPQSALSKLSNTEHLIRFLKSNAGEKFQ